MHCKSEITAFFRIFDLRCIISALPVADLGGGGGGGARDLSGLTLCRPKVPLCTILRYPFLAY